MLLVGAGVAQAAAPAPGGGIAGSPHDFSSVIAWNTTGEICKVCHIPHGGNTGAEAPLWNRRLTGETFTLYSSPTLNATLAQPDGVSKVCLSCHDGTVGLESFGSTGTLNSWADPALTTTNIIDADHLIGTSLANDHPISFVYDGTLVTADGGLNAPGGLTGVKLYSSKVQCASCHDVHNSTGTTVAAPLLRVTNVASALCLKCHNK
jgi:predicted CXXCH cytochrome family protein